MPKNELKEKILNEIATGATPAACADKYNIPAGTIRSWVSRCKKNKCNVAEKKPATQREKVATENKVMVEPKEPIIKIEDVSEDLTEKERFFCWRYIHNFNATQAYLWAFKCEYSTANSEAFKLLVKPSIKTEIARLKKIKFEAMQATSDDIVEKYMRIAFADITDFVDFKDYSVKLHDSLSVDGGLISEVKEGKEGISIKLLDAHKALDWLTKYFEMNPADKHKQRFDEEKLKIERERLALEQQKSNGTDDETATPDDGFIDALNAGASDVWADDGDDSGGE
jgi:phage terminase small subunit